MAFQTMAEQIQSLHRDARRTRVAAKPTCLATVLEWDRKGTCCGLRQAARSKPTARALKMTTGGVEDSISVEGLVAAFQRDWDLIRAHDIRWIVQMALLLPQ
jgi:hypothetical protein